MRIGTVIPYLVLGGLFLLGGSRALSSSPPIEEPRLADDRLGRLNAAFSENRTATARVRLELEHLFGTRDREIQELCLLWLDAHQVELGLEAELEVRRRLLAVDPKSDLVESLRLVVALGDLKRSPREERRRVYEAAVKHGGTVVSGVAITAERALYLAAEEGIAEVLPWLPRYRRILDSHANVWHCSNADVLQVKFEMRRGANDRVEARRMHAERLTGLKGEEIGERLTKESAFAMAFEELIRQVCGPGSDERSCFMLAEVLARQDLRSAEKGLGALQGATCEDGGGVIDRLARGLGTSGTRRYHEEVSRLRSKAPVN